MRMGVLQINTNYVVYHLHSDLSNGVTNIDSVTKYKEYVDKAKELNMRALSFSEHGSIFN
jgi:DNA polymerase-3 subunit alpha